MDKPIPPESHSTENTVVPNALSGNSAEQVDLPQTKLTNLLQRRITMLLIVTGGIIAGLRFIKWDQGSLKSSISATWKVGDTVDVNITLIYTDKQNLSCASTQEVENRHCAFETTSKSWSTDTSDINLLKPYTTTTQMQLLGAGLWSDPELMKKLPDSRFTVKCKYKIEGTIKNPSIRWDSESSWNSSNSNLFAGLLSSCVIIPPT